MKYLYDVAAREVKSTTKILPVHDGRSAPEGSWAARAKLGWSFTMFCGPVWVHGLAFVSSEADSEESTWNININPKY
jgi:hypothetical protein